MRLKRKTTLSLLPGPWNHIMVSGVSYMLLTALFEQSPDRFQWTLFVLLHLQAPEGHRISWVTGGRHNPWTVNHLQPLSNMHFLFTSVGRREECYRGGASMPCGGNALWDMKLSVGLIEDFTLLSVQYSSSCFKFTFARTQNIDALPGQSSLYANVTHSDLFHTVDDAALSNIGES